MAPRGRRQPLACSKPRPTKPAAEVLAALRADPLGSVRHGPQRRRTRCPPGPRARPRWPPRPGRPRHAWHRGLEAADLGRLVEWAKVDMETVLQGSCARGPARTTGRATPRPRHFLPVARARPRRAPRECAASRGRPPRRLADRRRVDGRRRIGTGCEGPVMSSSFLVQAAGARLGQDNAAGSLRAEERDIPLRRACSSLRRPRAASRRSRRRQSRAPTASSG